MLGRQEPLSVIHPSYVIFSFQGSQVVHILLVDLSCAYTQTFLILYKIWILTLMRRFFIFVNTGPYGRETFHIIPVHNPPQPPTVLVPVQWHFCGTLATEHAEKCQKSISKGAIFPGLLWIPHKTDYHSCDLVAQKDSVYQVSHMQLLSAWVNPFNI